MPRRPTASSPGSSALARHAKQLEAVRAISEEITKELSLDRLLDVLVRRAIELVEGAAGGVFLWDEGTQLLQLRAEQGCHPSELFPRRLGEGLVGGVAQRRESALVEDYPASAYALPELVREASFTAALGAPLLYHGRLLGVLAFNNGRTGHRFTPHDLETLNLFAAQAAIAIENARLHSMAISRAQQLATMNELTRSLSTTLETAQVVQKTLAAIQVLFPDCVAEFLEPAAGGEALRLIDITGLRAGKRLVRSEFRVNTGLVGLAAATRQPVISPDVAQDPRFLNKAWAAEEGVVSAIVLPLVHQDRLHGVLSVLMRTPYRFAQEEMDLLYSFAVHAAIAVENARLYEVAQRRAEEFATLNDVTRTLTTTLDPAEVATRTVQAVQALLPQSSVRLWEHGPEEGLFRQVAAVGLSPQSAPAVVRFAPGDGMMGLVLATRQPAISRDVRCDPRFRDQARARAVGLVSGLMLPLLAKDRIYGILAIFTRTLHEFPAEELNLLTSFAAQATVALENARLYAELKRAYDDLTRTQDELIRSEKLRAVGQLGAGMAHDLNNVLAAILGQVELLKLRTTDPDVREGLLILETAATDGADVVRHLQDFARPRGASPLVPVDLAALVREVLEITRSRWKDEPERRGVRIDVRSALATLPPVLGYAPEIREALINLIFNAVDAMPQGGTLSVLGEADAEGVRLAVCDTGMGMSTEVRERVFEPFFTTKGPQGMGLGLSVVYGIMERLGGRIELESAPGRGTAVRLGFQIAPASPDRVVAPARQAKPRRLLLIDDDHVVRQTIGNLLRAGGHSVVEAESGTEALARLGEIAPDLVLTDLGMPEMTGWEVARMVKAAAPTLPVVLLTGWGDQAAAEAERGGPVDRVLSKPVRLDDLLAMITELTESPRS